MASKTNTFAQQVFHRNDPQDPLKNAIFRFDSDATRPEVTEITLPKKSTWSPGLHWHERHTEYFKVTKGRVVLKLDGVLKTVTPTDERQRVDKFVVHDFWRADRDLPDHEKDPDDVITEEWTDPADGVKHVFFRNIFSTLQDSEKYWGRWTYIQALLVAATYDDFIEVVPGRLSYTATHLLYASMRLFGRTFGGMFGLRPWHEEYTPVSLRAVASGAKDSKVE